MIRPILLAVILFGITTCDIKAEVPSTCTQRSGNLTAKQWDFVDAAIAEAGPPISTTYFFPSSGTTIAVEPGTSLPGEEDAGAPIKPRPKPVWHKTQLVDRKDYPAVVKVHGPGGAMGSGVAVRRSSDGTHTIVLTALHVVAGAAQGNWVEANGKRYEASNATMDRFGYDLAALFVRGADIPTLDVATEMPDVGSAFGWGGEPGTPEGLYSHSQDAGDYLGGKVRQGDSGGPILDRGTPPKVLGIISARGGMHGKQGDSYQGTVRVAIVPAQVVSAFLGRIVHGNVFKTQWDP